MDGRGCSAFTLTKRTCFLWLNHARRKVVSISSGKNCKCLSGGKVLSRCKHIQASVGAACHSSAVVRWSFISCEAEHWGLLNLNFSHLCDFTVDTHCTFVICRASPILLAIGVPPDIARNAIRLSVGRETTKRNIDLVIRDLKQAVESLENEQTAKWSFDGGQK